MQKASKSRLVRPAEEGFRLGSEALTFPEEDEITRALSGA